MFGYILFPTFIKLYWEKGNLLGLLSR